MATTALWRVTDHSLSDVIDYVCNPDKTYLANVLEYAVQETKTGSSLSPVMAIDSSTDTQEPPKPKRHRAKLPMSAAETQIPLEMMRSVKYRLRKKDEDPSQAADKSVFVTGINCSGGASAAREMYAVKQRFGKLGGTVAYHGYQSFKGWETTPEIAHQIGVDLARRLWGSRFQVVVTTHLDRESHLHNHFVINTVSFIDGKKFYRSAQDYREMRDTSDDLCREYGLSVVIPDRKKLSVRDLTLKAAIDDACARTSSVDEFAAAMMLAGYSVVLSPDKKHWTAIGPGWKRSRRIDQLGDDYTNEKLLARINGDNYENGASIVNKVDTPIEKWRNSKLSPRDRIAKEAIDSAIAESKSLSEFEAAMKTRGYELDLNPAHRFWTVRGIGWERPRRMYHLGIDYTNDRILERLSGERDIAVTTRGNSFSGASIQKRKRVRVGVRGNVMRSRRVTGFRALYFRYCYMLGIYPAKKTRRNRRVHYVLVSDLQKLDAISEESKLLSKHHIGSINELQAFRDARISRIDFLCERRRELYNASRTVSVKSDMVRLQKIKNEIAQTSGEISSLRKEVRLCDDIESRSPVIKEKLRNVCEDEKRRERDARTSEKNERRYER